MRLLFVLMLCISSQAQAYIGPGAGITLLGSVAGFLSILLVGFTFILMWPLWVLRRRWKRRKNSGGSTVQSRKYTDTQP